ncbi:unnamed protein product [Orchesella dallaii]|uniref:Uncharacterized protein n=1 Tax=Orchesella dallaii TaxID=48710 RepID=A0ABP1QZL3_9HEXA
MKFVFVLIVIIIGDVSFGTHHGETEIHEEAEDVTPGITTIPTADIGSQKEETEIVSPYIYIRTRNPAEQAQTTSETATEETIDYEELQKLENVVVPRILGEKSSTEAVAIRATTSPPYRFPESSIIGAIASACHDMDKIVWWDTYNFWWAVYKCNYVEDMEKIIGSEHNDHLKGFQLITRACREVGPVWWNPLSWQRCNQSDLHPEDLDADGTQTMGTIVGSCKSGLQKLSFQNSEEVSKRLEQELRRSMRRCHIRFLTKSVRILNKNEDLETSIGSSQEDSTVLPAAIKVLNCRWIEAVTGNELISFSNH